jgi:hypothetical protein
MVTRHASKDPCAHEAIDPWNFGFLRTLEENPEEFCNRFTAGRLLLGGSFIKYSVRT